MPQADLSVWVGVIAPALPVLGLCQREGTPLGRVSDAACRKRAAYSRSAWSSEAPIPLPGNSPAMVRATVAAIRGLPLPAVDPSKRIDRSMDRYIADSIGLFTVSFAFGRLAGCASELFGAVVDQAEFDIGEANEPVGSIYGLTASTWEMNMSLPCRSRRSVGRGGTGGRIVPGLARVAWRAARDKARPAFSGPPPAGCG